MIPGVILAGGASSRMGGRPKALLPTGRGDETFLGRIASTLVAGGVDDVVVVAGYHDQAIRRFVEGLPTPVRLLTNLNPGEGQLSSLLVALRAVDRPQLRAVIVTLVDLPLVSASTVRAVLDGYRRTGAPLVRPERDGRHGHPVLFDRSLFDELRAADPEHGAKPVVRAHAARGLDVPTEDDGAFTDIDTPQDYERVFDRPLSPGTE
ncbi:MAG TPA: hypothetical protein DEQ98_03465 [Acidobacteria bacterium]|nr:hypothetical protein [Acidobacteriota bacterium]